MSGRPELIRTRGPSGARRIIWWIKVISWFVFGDIAQRHEAGMHLRGALLRKLDVTTYVGSLWWMHDPDVLPIWREFLPSAPAVPDKKYVVYMFAKSLACLTGDTVECGVFKGASSYMICAANRHKQEHIHHVFDSFEGLSEIQAEDITPFEESWLVTPGSMTASLDTAQFALHAFPFVRYYKGWIPERFPEVADRQFSFVHVDVDLYQPTRDSLEFFYERLIPGGVIMCDDYGFAHVPGARKAFDEMIADKPERFVIHLPTGQGFIVKRI